MKKIKKVKKDKKFEFTIDRLEELLIFNKTGNYSSNLMRLLAYIIIKFNGSKSIQLWYQEDRWLKRNFFKTKFNRCLGFLKQKDIIQTIFSRKKTYRINYRLLGELITNDLDIDILLEIKEHYEEMFDFLAERRKNTKLIKLQDEKLSESERKSVKEKGVNSFSFLTPKHSNSLINNNIIANRDKGGIYKGGKGDVKLKKIKKIKGIESGSDFRKETRKREGFYKGSNKNKKLRKDSTVLYGEYRRNPSENPKLNSWRNRNIRDWRPIEFLGYYIYLYREEVGRENVAMQDDQTYIKFKNAIRKILRNWFDNDRKEMKEYLEWAVYYFTNEMDERYMPSVNLIFDLYGKVSWVFDTYIGTKVKRKKKKRKDSDWASNDKWKGN